MTASKSATGLRKDPPRRAAPTSLDWNRLEGANPNMHYTWVRRSQIGVYKTMGYKVSSPESGVRCAAASVEQDDRLGSIVENKDTVLMEIPLEDWEAIQQHGLGGAGGQDWSDQMEALMNRRNRLQDGLRPVYRGPGGQVEFLVQNIDGISDQQEMTDG